MKPFVLAVLSALVIVPPTTVTAAPAAAPTLLAPGARIEKIASGFKFTEGPAVDRQGNVYFTDQPNDRIVKWDAATGTTTNWMKPAGRANGLYFDAAGNLIACADATNALWSIAPDRTITVLASGFDQHLFNGPNDVWVHPDGGLYFTDPLYARSYWTRSPKRQQDGDHVYHLGADRKTVRRVTTDLKQPNGIIGTPDGKTLYVADIGARQTYAYQIEPDGNLSHRRLFCSMGSDGMTIDAEGNVYLTGRGVTVFNPAGEKIENLPIPEPWTANVTFGGPQRDLLFITASGNVYGARLRVRGAGPPAAR